MRSVVLAMGLLGLTVFCLLLGPLAAKDLSSKHQQRERNALPDVSARAVEDTGEGVDDAAGSLSADVPEGNEKGNGRVASRLEPQICLISTTDLFSHAKSCVLCVNCQ